jgi:hypothetical protein
VSALASHSSDHGAHRFIAEERARLGPARDLKPALPDHVIGGGWSVGPDEPDLIGTWSFCPSVFDGAFCSAKAILTILSMSAY